MMCRSQLLRIAMASVGLCSAMDAQKLDVAHLGPAEYRSHFAPNLGTFAGSGSRDGWESYPLAEDAGYDPTIDPITMNGVSMLTRAAAPTQDGSFGLGFIKRLHLVSGANASIHVWMQVPDATGATPVHLSVFRGAREERHNAVVADGTWREIVCKLSPSPDAITALAVEAEFPHGVHGRQERVFLRDVSLKAMGTTRIALRAPDALWDAARGLYYLQRGFLPDSDLHVVMDGASGSTQWTLSSPDGALKAKGSGTEVRYHFAATDTPGAWTIHAATKSAETTALALLRPAQPWGLVFDQAPSVSPELLRAVRARRDKLRTTANVEMGSNIARMDPDWLLAGLPSYFSILSQPPELAMLDAIDYRSTGDRAALDESRRLLAGIARWPLWVHPWFPAHGYHSYYPVGIMTRYLVMAEQFLGDDLAATDRASLDHRLMDLSVRPIYEEYVLEDRLQFNTSNWIGNTVGGALLAALASNDQDSAGYALGLYVKERDHVRAAYTSDGSYGEGVSYQRYDLETTAVAAAAVKRLLGQSLDTNLMPAERYMRYATFGTAGVLDYGDSHVDLKPANVFAYLASLNQSDRLTNFYFKYRGDNGDLLSRVLWEREIHPTAKTVTDEPASALFDRRGIAVLRDSWIPESSVIAMRAGQNFNHNHADQGSVFFAHGGKLWLGEAGYADYYKDPSFPTFNAQAVGHNTLLIDGNPESQVPPGNAVFGTAPSIMHSLIGPQASLLQADLTAAYGAKLTGYTRTLFFQANGPLLVIDQVKADVPHIYTQVWHPKQKIDAVDTSHHSFRLTDGSHDLVVRAFGSAPLTTVQRDSPMPLASYDKAEHEAMERPKRFEISTDKPESSAMIATIVQPDGRESAADATWKQLGSVASLTMKNAGVEIDQANSSITAHWDHGAMAIHTIRHQDWLTGGTLLFGKPVDMRLTRNEDGSILLEVDAPAATDLHMQGFTFSSGAHTAPLGEGRTTLTFRDEPSK